MMDMRWTAFTFWLPSLCFAFNLAVVFDTAAATSASLCEKGRSQSPIDIRSTTHTSLPALQFDYQRVPLIIENDGHTARIRLPSKGRLQIGGTKYVLNQFHFHTPGGDRIAGEEFPLVVHVLHKGPTGQLLGVVVPYRLGINNLLLDRLFPLIPSKADGAHSVPGQTVSAAELLPEKRGYFRYTGSLTATPCTEGVEWIVLKQVQTISADQLAAYKTLFKDNMRSPQPLNQRVVLESP